MGAGFCLRRETRRSISGSPGNPRGRAPQTRKLHPRPQRPAGKRWAGAAQPKQQEQPPPSAPDTHTHSGLLSTQHWGAGSGSERQGTVPALRQPPPGAVVDPRRRRQVGPGCRSLCLKGGRGRGARRERDRGAWPSAPTKTRVAQGWVLARPINAVLGLESEGTLPWRAAGVGRETAGRSRGPAHSQASGHTQPPGAQSPSRARTPGLVHSRHPGRAQPRAHSCRQNPLGLGAHVLRGTPTAAAAGLAEHRRQPKLRPALPPANTTEVPAFARGKKKKDS